ncbi:hypothetical protein [Gemmatimonas sp.]|uniref:hypothetical protein n=1 Tax=Gemmatimonas sp. TaxID=1962908 RepID=UPI00398321D2
MTPTRSDESDGQPAVPPASPAQDADVVRDADGLVVDEYSDETFTSAVDMDALDRPRMLGDTDALAEVADDSDGITERDLSVSNHNDMGDADMGLGAEPRSAEELEEAAIGHELKGPAAVTRDDDVHGERMFDSPDATLPRS